MFRMRWRAYICCPMCMKILLCHDHLFLNGLNDLLMTVMKLNTNNVLAVYDQNISKINYIICKNQRLSIRMIVEILNIGKQIVRQILHNHLNIHYIQFHQKK